MGVNGKGGGRFATTWIYYIESKVKVIFHRTCQIVRRQSPAPAPSVSSLSSQIFLSIGSKSAANTFALISRRGTLLHNGRPMLTRPSMTE